LIVAHDRLVMEAMRSGSLAKKKLDVTIHRAPTCPVSCCLQLRHCLAKIGYSPDIAYINHGRTLAIAACLATGDCYFIAMKVAANPYRFAMPNLGR
jgi:hypothetical protein